jgi:hypothetical protein
MKTHQPSTIHPIPSIPTMSSTNNTNAYAAGTTAAAPTSGQQATLGSAAPEGTHTTTGNAYEGTTGAGAAQGM